MSGLIASEQILQVSPLSPQVLQVSGRDLRAMKLQDTNIDMTKLSANTQPTIKFLRAPLTRRALKQLERDLGIYPHKSTSADQDLACSNIEDEMTDQSTENPHKSTSGDQDLSCLNDESELNYRSIESLSPSERGYRDGMQIDISELGIMEQQVDSHVPRIPSDFFDIRTALAQEIEDCPGLEDYALYLSTVFGSIEKPETKEMLFSLVFGTSRKKEVNAKSGHIIEYNKEWSSYTPFIDEWDWPRRLYEQKPRPDYAEGIDQTIIGEEILESRPAIIVNNALALPNFFAEFNHDSSFCKHSQNRHNGAIATRAWRHIAKYIYKGYDSREHSLEVTQAGSVEFNGDYLTGNIHWANKHEFGDNRRLKRPKYYMVRVFSRFIIGFDYDEFALAIKEARNFRQYFSNRRDYGIQAIQEAIID